MANEIMANVIMANVIMANGATGVLIHDSRRRAIPRWWSPFLLANCLLLGCAADGNRVIDPASSEPAADAVADYERDKQQMISARD